MHTNWVQGDGMTYKTFFSFGKELDNLREHEFDTIQEAFEYFTDAEHEVSPGYKFDVVYFEDTEDNLAPLDNDFVEELQNRMDEVWEANKQGAQGESWSSMAEYRLQISNNV
jgi:hypothetical protein